MSDKVENQEINSMENSNEKALNETVEVESTSSEESKISNIENEEPVSDKDNDNLLSDNEIVEKYKSLSQFIKDFSQKRKDLDDELNMRKEYLSESLTKYDSEDYLQNPDFRELYSAAFNKLGVSLNTDNFVSLLDKYVDSRLSSYSKKIAANKENESATDKLEFQNGYKEKSVKKLKMQDIPPNELEKYIAKYI